MMQRFSVLIILILFFAACSPKNEYRIQGEFKQEVSGPIYLQERVNGAFVNIDSSEVNDKGEFSFKGAVDGIDEYYLSLSDREKVLFFLENERFRVVVDSTLANAQITGGEVQNLYNSYKEKYDRLYDYMMKEYNTMRGLPDGKDKAAREAHIDSLYENIGLFQKTFMMEHPTSPVAGHLLTRIQYGKAAGELAELLAQLDPSLAGTRSYDIMVERVKALQKVDVGQLAPDFTQNDVDGNPLRFSEVYSQNKYTLIDFWASWCGPCRVENPNVVAAFEKYNDQGFTVFGVSLDRSKENWLEAIEKDQLSWLHVSDLQGWGNEFAKAYAVNSIPANFLVDSEGRIVAANLRGEDLHLKLEELLGAN